MENEILIAPLWHERRKRVWELIEPICQACGIDLVHVEFGPEPKGFVLRIFIDRPGGITIDDCADISRQAGDIIDIYLEMPEGWRLEVSSPGLDRPLGKKADFDLFKGKRAKIKTAKPVFDQRNFTGDLLGVENNQILLSLDGQTVRIPFEKITKARLFFQDGE